MKSQDELPVSDQRLHGLLVNSSRTFALAIPQLPPRLQREVTIAYLLFRIADTLEDAGDMWSKERQLSSLGEFEALLRRPQTEDPEDLVASWLRDPPTDHEGYAELLLALPEVVSSWRALPEASRESIGEHTRRTTRRMAEFVEKSDSRGVIELLEMEDLRRYCYAVAGIVGEMLTDLFLISCPQLAEVGDDLRSRAAAFGEGLQLVNILKDSAGDEVEGRNYIPQGVDRSEIFSLARSDLDEAVEYCLAVQGADAPGGVVSFVALPVALAWATLDRVEASGPGSKISRTTVFQLHHQVCAAIDAGRPVLERRGSP